MARPFGGCESAPSGRLVSTGRLPPDSSGRRPGRGRECDEQNSTDVRKTIALAHTSLTPLFDAASQNLTIVLTDC